jgi:hypothetical protein
VKKTRKSQAAYRKSKGCESHVFSLNAILQNILSSKKGRVYALFIDLSKTFDKQTNIRILDEKSREFPPYLLKQAKWETLGTSNQHSKNSNCRLV